MPTYTEVRWQSFVLHLINSTISLQWYNLSKCYIKYLTPSLPLSLPISLSPELASDGLKGRVFEVSLADLQNDEVAYRKFRLVSEDVQGKNVLTNFHGMTMTTDKLRSLVKKWQVRHNLQEMSRRSLSVCVCGWVCVWAWVWVWGGVGGCVRARLWNFLCALTTVGALSALFVSRL